MNVLFVVQLAIIFLMIIAHVVSLARATLRHGQQEKPLTAGKIVFSATWYVGSIFVMSINTPFNPAAWQMIILHIIYAAGIVLMADALSKGKTTNYNVASSILSSVIVFLCKGTAGFFWPLQQFIGGING